MADAMLDRHGLLTRGAVIAERIEGGFSAVYPVLKAAEEAGRVRRGYFVERLGAAQFASTGAVDRLRALAAPDRVPSPALALAATDPANPYGAALPWPDRAPATADGTAPAPTERAADSGEPGADPVRGARRGHQAGRKAGAVVVLVDGELVLYVERGGRTVLSYAEEPSALDQAALALAAIVRTGALGRIQVEKADGEPVSRSPLSEALERGGFRATPRGLRLRA
jgi:ATP-dependent Lhr-like helicase